MTIFIPLLFLTGLSLAETTKSDSGSTRENKVASPAQPGEMVGEYILGPGDVFELLVWGYDDLRQLVTVPPNGIPTIYPIGKVKASGMTSTQLGKKIAKELARYIKEIPNVTVVVKEYNYYRVYVLGEVAKPGLYPFKGRLTLLEAVTLAGSPTRRAFTRRVQVVRRDPDNPGKARVMNVNLYRIVRRGKVGEDIALQPSDIVYVPGSILSGLNDVITQITPPIQFLYYVDNLTR